jgi:hypothetical protein
MDAWLDERYKVYLSQDQPPDATIAHLAPRFPDP